MKKVLVVTAVLALLCVGVTVNAYVWTFTNASDYYTNNAVVTALPGGGSAYVAPRTVNTSDSDDVEYGADWAAVFAKINTQAPSLGIGSITSGGFTVSGMNHPGAAYGSLYLSPTGVSGSNVMINMSPMSLSGSGGAYVYTFDLSSLVDVKLLDGAGGSWGLAHYAGTLDGAFAWINSNGYGSNYAAFFGPQIGMSGTSETTFTVSRIEVAVPEPSTLLLLGSGLLGLVVAGRKKFRK